MHIAKRGLDSICTSDTSVHLVMRPEIKGAHKLARTLALRGDRLSRTEFHDPSKPYCDDPQLVGLRARRMADLAPVEASAWRPCRKCAKCLQFRQIKWRNRALSEIKASKRSWFITLTFSPVHLAGILLEAKSGDNRAIERCAYRHVQRYFKRLRKNHPLAKFRYFAVYERGEQTGRSHYHVLLHEVGERPVMKLQLEKQWVSNVHARLVAVSQGGAATYITKYATKSFDIRPRASANYGKGSKCVSHTRRLPSPNTSSEFDAPPSFSLKAVGSNLDVNDRKRNGKLTFDICAARSKAGCWFAPGDQLEQRLWYTAKAKLVPGQYKSAANIGTIEGECC